MSRFLLSCLLLLSAVPTYGSIVVGTKLSLVIDVSGSINSTDYSLMMTGYKNAFLDSTVQTNIMSQTGGIAVNVVQFGQTAASQGPTWHHLNSLASINAFANYIGGLARDNSVGTWTNIAKGMEISRGILADQTQFSSNRLVMDVSGDGQQNRTLNGSSGLSGVAADNLVKYQRDQAFGQGIKVNGLAITTDVANLDAYYTNNVKTNGAPLDGFVLKANTFAAFEAAVRQKIVFETQNAVPEPGSLTVFAMLLLGGAATSRLRRRR